MTEEPNLEFVEDQVPLAGIEVSGAEIVELVGGTIESVTSSGIRFTLPERRGASGAAIECLLSWSDDDGGTVRLKAEREVAAPKLQRLILLGTGALGAFLWLLWPFFPHLGALAWMGGAIAIATYFVSLRRTPVGAAADLLQRLVSRQRELASPEEPA
ncbi:MAG TPA: hypothetical protein VNM92_17915 [Thermoanaerobaculia bacterium]|nr:hypothetical protein [Thermoanaerobaculia bacterium]